MPHYVYVAAQDDNKIGIFTMDADTGALTHQADVAMPGGPSLLAISPDKRTLYVSLREALGLSSHRIDPSTGGITETGSVTVEDWPAYLATDRTGRHLLVAFYGGARAGVYPIGADGELGGPPTESLTTADGAHAILTDRSNRFAYVPHIAYVQDNVLEPPKNIPGPNMIHQFRFDADTGRLTPNDPLVVEMGGFLGPRHYTYHPSLDVVYFSDEQGSSVTAYNMDSEGRLSALQTISTLPEGHTERNTCSQIQMTSDGRFLFVPNRGHNSIASFTVDAQTGALTAAGRASTEAVPSAFSLDPQGKFVFGAGSATGRLSSHSIDGETGDMTPLATYDVGARPMWVLTTTLGE
jgi:6-phosphogluconolactonase